MKPASRVNLSVGLPLSAGDLVGGKKARPGFYLQNGLTWLLQSLWENLVLVAVKLIKQGKQSTPPVRSEKENLSRKYKPDDVCNN